MDLGQMAEEGCNEECSFGRKCIRRADWYAAYTMRKTFWGDKNADPYVPKERLRQIINIFQYCEAAKVYMFILVVFFLY